MFIVGWTAESIVRTGVMNSKRTSMILRHICRRLGWNCRSYASINFGAGEQKDPAPLFFNSEVQQILKTLTRLDYEKVFRTYKDGRRMKAPEYKFMTDQQLQEAMAEASCKAEKRLQMPPVMKEHSTEIKVMSRDPALQGHDTSKYVFTDISFGISNRKRLIVVRDEDGTLRHATMSERDRMNQVYYPTRGKEMHIPKMFGGEYLMSLLDKQEYEFILNRACIQFEPDDPEYLRIVKDVYSHVKSTKKFELLRSTRHFGPMVFHFVWNNDIDNLLEEILGNNRIDEAALLIRLYYKLHPTNSTEIAKYDENEMGLVEYYTKTNSVNRKSIERAIAIYKKLQDEQKKVESGIKKAHGYTGNTSDTCT